MQLPMLALSMLPELTDHMTAIFGATRTPNPGHNDTIVVLATFLYESNPPRGFF